MKGVLAVVVAAGLLASVISTGLAVTSSGIYAERLDDGQTDANGNQPTTIGTVYSDFQGSEDDGDGILYDGGNSIISSSGSGDSVDDDSVSEEENSSSDDSLSDVDDAEDDSVSEEENSSSDDSLNGEDVDDDGSELEEGDGSPSPGLARMEAELSGSKEVPPVDTNATGSGWFTLNTVENTLTYAITYSGLGGNETGAHIHGFAGEGTEANVLYTLPLGDSKAGTWHYNESQESQILEGLAYVNIHSVQYPDGEIRGQIVVKGIETPSETAFSLEPEDADSDATGHVAISLEEHERYDSVKLAATVENLEPAAGKVFEGWLVDTDSGYWLSTGAFITGPDGGAAVERTLQLVDFGIYDRFVITEEDVGDTDPGPDTTVLSGQIGS